MYLVAICEVAHAQCCCCCLSPALAAARPGCALQRSAIERAGSLAGPRTQTRRHVSRGRVDDAIVKMISNIPVYRMSMLPM
jgi:hypothetical protein